VAIAAVVVRRVYVVMAREREKLIRNNRAISGPRNPTAIRMTPPRR